MTAADEFIIDTSGLHRTAEIEAVRQTLDLVAEDAATIEADIPWSEARGWPEEAEVAARWLATVSKDKDPVYQRTGIVPAGDQARQAFRTFAPFAYGAHCERCPDRNGRR